MGSFEVWGEVILVGPEHEHKNPTNLEATFFRDIL